MEAIHSAGIVERADYVSGRDKKSVWALSQLLKTAENPRVQASDVRTVRDPVLGDSYYTDVNEKCWQKDAGEEFEGCAVHGWLLCACMVVSVFGRVSVSAPESRKLLMIMPQNLQLLSVEKACAPTSIRQRITCHPVGPGGVR